MNPFGPYLSVQPRAAATVPQSQFAEAAKAINAGITSVATKLQDLTKRASSAYIYIFIIFIFILCISLAD